MTKVIERVYFPIVVIGGLLKMFYLFSVSPDGSWDAWAIWNRAALFLYHNSPHQFSTEVAHADYPLLLPTITATGWKLIGSTTTLVPILVALVFTLGLVGLLWVALRHFATTQQAYLLTTALIISPDFVTYGTIQLADIPLAFFTV